MRQQLPWPVLCSQESASELAKLEAVHPHKLSLCSWHPPKKVEQLWD